MEVFEVNSSLLSLSLFHFSSYIHIFNLYIYLYTHLYFNCRAFSTWAIRLGGLGNHPLPYWHKINCIVLYCAQVPQKKRFVQGLDTEAWSLWRKSLPFRRNWVGHLNTIFATWGGNLNKPIFKSSNAFGEITWWCCPGEGGEGKLKLQIDWCIISI